ncbi:tachylectin-related carbohydrate-binding protein [Streptomyces sp. NPDC008141]|uniref:tachylectin-related carbohydrate-binding protein n=1 Tax=Streptomyces sp. NPDC008141 TaxID=3364815 RepID=UPI0036F06FF4
MSLIALAPGGAQAVESATCAANGLTYVTNSTGDLLQYTMATPLTGSTFSPYSKVGAGWGAYGKVLAGPAGEFYAFKSDGTYYAHRTPSGTWDVAPKKISTALGWLSNAADRDQATVDRNGWLWVADNLGQLYAYRYDATIGTTGGLRSLKILDKGWDRYNLITAGDAGVLYGRATDGRLYRSRYDYTSQRWLERHVLVGAAAWKNFKSITAGGGDTVLAVQTSGEALHYRYDENTNTWPVVAKEVAAGGWQNFTNVTSRPDNCKLVKNHTPASPSVPVEEWSATAALSVSTVEMAFSNHDGTLKHGRADAADLNGAQWTTLGDTFEAFTGKPSLSALPDGRVVVTAHTLLGAVHQRVQKEKGSADWIAWRDLGGAMAQHPVSAKAPSGALALFAVDADGKAWYRIQTNGDYMGWMPLPGAAFSGPLSAVPVRNGSQLFGRSTAGLITTATLQEDGTLSAWATVGTQTITGPPTVLSMPGSRIRVFATDPNGTVVTTAQSTEGGPFSAWSSLEGVTAAGPPSVVPRPSDGYLQVVVRGADNRVHTTGATSASGTTWRPWSEAVSDELATDPTAFVYSTGSFDNWAFTFRNANNQPMVYNLNTGGLDAARSAGGKPSFTRHVFEAPK